MRNLLLFSVIFLFLAGSGCLETVLEYPKDDSSTNNQTEAPTISVSGVIQSLDSGGRLMLLKTVLGLEEEITVAANAVISIDNAEGRLLNDIPLGAVAEIFGTRDPATLIITARTVRADDLTKIKIVSPKESNTVTSPLIVDSFVKIAGQKIHWRIKDQNGSEKLSGFSEINGNKEAHEPFRLEIYLPALETNGFTLEVFAKQNDLEIGLVALPLRLLSTNKSSFQVFLANNSLNAAWSCTAVFPVDRTVAETSAVGRAALIELLNGPTETEQWQGYRSSLPLNTTIPSFIIVSKTATVTVSKNIEQAGNCEKQRAFEQIKQTLLQIDLVDGVVIQIEK